MFNKILILIAVLAAIGHTQTAQTGVIRGIVIDKETKETLYGANVSIVGTSKGAVADEKGSFVIKDVPVASYVLQFSYIGYVAYKLPDVIVRPERITYIQAEMTIESIEGEAIEVSAGYFDESNSVTTSVTQLSNEEIRRSSAAAGDVSRIISSLPSVAKTDEQKNSLAVRGGSPIENAFFVDHIEIPNINHFPSQGSSGGAIGILNVDLIRNVNFYTGGFSSAYGNRLSSILDLELREGNREEFDGQVDLSIAGIGGVFEGPVSGTDGKKGSWVVSVRRSYVDVIAKMIDANVTPWYADAQAKLVYDIAPSHQISLLYIAGLDQNDISRKQGKKLDVPSYGSESHLQNTVGANWRWLWNKNGYSNTSISYSGVAFKTDFDNARTTMLLFKNHSSENALRIRNTNFYRFNSIHAIEFGFESSLNRNTYDQVLGENTDPLGQTTPAFQVKKDLNAVDAGGYLNYLVKPFSSFQASLGLRSDYFSLTNQFHLSPRVALGYAFTPRTSANVSAGMFFQNLPLTLLAQDKDYKKMKDPYAIHYIASLNHLLSEDTKLTIEAYHKSYYRFPTDPAQPNLFMIDELQYRQGFFYGHSSLTDQGRAYSTGVEVTIQKKLAKHLYGLISGTYYQSRYRGQDHVWRDRVFDNRYIVSMEGGYKPNKKWEFSGRWIYAGGAPYTPLDPVASAVNQQAVFDATQINAKRYPAYHALNLRVDRRFSFSHSNLVTYLSIWNAYNRKNVASYYWNEIDNKPATAFQWGLVPVVGMEYEF